jgi:hypothetical protein
MGAGQAASATFALKAGTWVRRVRLAIVAPDPRHPRRFQADFPLIDLSEFGRPPLIATATTQNTAAAPPPITSQRPHPAVGRASNSLPTNKAVAASSKRTGANAQSGPSRKLNRAPRRLRVMGDILIPPSIARMTAATQRLLNPIHSQSDQCSRVATLCGLRTFRQGDPHGFVIPGRSRRASVAGSGFVVSRDKSGLVVFGAEYRFCPRASALKFFLDQSRQGAGRDDTKGHVSLRRSGKLPQQCPPDQQDGQRGQGNQRDHPVMPWPRLVEHPGPDP